MGALGAASASTVVTGVASGVMPPQVLGGPIYVLMEVLIFSAGMLAAFVVLDAARRAIAHGDHEAERFRWGYFVPQLVYLVLMLLGQFEMLPILIVGIVILCTPLALIQGIAYLLLVTFPKHPAPVPTPEELELFTGDEESPEPESHVPGSVL